MVEAADIGRRLQRARAAAGLSQAEVAETLGVPRPAVSLMESGQRTVSSVELARLARLYRRPAGYFLVEPAQEQPLLQRFRAAAPVQPLDDEVLQEAEEWCRYYAWLEQAAYGEQRYEVPTYPLPRGRAIDQGEYLARQERQRLGLGTAPIPSVIDVLEEQGVKVVLRRFPAGSSVSGCYFFSQDMGSCVIVAEQDPVSRRRFTAAHEYSHFLVEGDDINGEICAPARRQEFSEMRANAFAAALLLPPTGIGEYLADLDVEQGAVKAEHAAHLMFDFGVSYEAVLWRLLNLGWISADGRQRLSGVSWSALARALGYENRQPGDSETAPDRFRVVAIDAWRAGEISLGKLSELLDVPSSELRRVLSRPELQQVRPARAPAAEPDWF